MLDKEEALIYVMILAASSDGEIHPSEKNRIFDIVDRYPVFKNMDSARIEVIANAVFEELNFSEFETLLSNASKSLDDIERQMAFVFASLVISADGIISDQEKDFMKHIGKILDIDDVSFSKLTYPLAIAFGARTLEEIN